MLRDKAGNRLFRRVNIKVIFPDNVLQVQKITQRAGSHQGFSPEGIDDILMQVTEKLDANYPFWEFNLVPMAPTGREANYVIKFSGYREVSNILPKKQSSATDLGAAEGNSPDIAGNMPVISAVLGPEVS